LNRISLEEGREIAERLLEEALIRLDISNHNGLQICDNIFGLFMKC
jgi:hypothetical protein